MAKTDSIMRTVVMADIETLSDRASPLGNSDISNGLTRRRGNGRIRWFLGLLSVILLLGAIIWATKWLLTTESLAINKVRIEGELRHTTMANLQNTLIKEITGNFFTVDLDGIHKALEALPWIAQAHVYRVWPLTLVVWVREQSVLARWGEKFLVSPEGNIFKPESDKMPTKLVLLQGPDENVQQVIDRYHWLQERFTPLGMQITRIILSTRHSWSIDISSGLKLAVGSKDFEARITRFLHYLPQLPQPEALAKVDLRYVNGFATVWQDVATSQQQQ